MFSELHIDFVKHVAQATHRTVLHHCFLATQPRVSPFEDIAKFLF